jgi:hypothetical protein
MFTESVPVPTLGCRSGDTPVVPETDRSASRYVSITFDPSSKFSHDSVAQKITLPRGKSRRWLIHEQRVGLLRVAAIALTYDETTAARRVLMAVPKTISAKEAVVLSATWGLLNLHDGNFDDARKGYEQAEQLARHHGRSDWVPQIRQKMHLEFARAYSRQGDVKAAAREIKRGLTKPGQDVYRRDLEQMSRMLQHRSR